MKTKPFAILLVLITTIFTSTAQVFWKFGADRLVLTLMGIITNYHIWIGFFFYGIAAIILIFSLKHGELSVLYPVVATSYIWVSLLAVRFFGESITPLKWVGIASILFGISLIGFGSQVSTDSPSPSSPITSEVSAHD